MSIGKLRGAFAPVVATALLAGLIVSAPAALAVDVPTADYKATFQACPPDAIPSWEFEDVPSTHPNAANIACISYYGVTKGTSHTTYSPTTPVTRQQMALFLTRLARLVGISVPAAGSTNFVDIGDLNAETQTAISQLVQLGVSVGTSSTTFSPASPVRRDDMALFIERLMNLMTPMEGHGYIPSDVTTWNAPFRDIRQLSAEKRQAIGRLWNLGVMNGTGSVAYFPAEVITRDSMAGFLAGVLNHSNARPEGLTIQTNGQVLWGTDPAPLVAVSYRDENFRPVDHPVTVDVFSSPSENVTLCAAQPVSGDCRWNSADAQTNGQGNIFVNGPIALGTTRTYYAWIGTAENQVFAADQSDYRKATVAVEYPEEVIVIGTTLNHHTLLTSQGKPVNFNDVSDVQIIGALRSNTAGIWVERPGVKVSLEYIQGNPHHYFHDFVTDTIGRVNYWISSPNQARTDRIKMTIFDEAGNKVHQNEEVLRWTDEPAVLSSDSVEVPAQVNPGEPEVTIKVSLWDQYGVPYENGNDRIKVRMWIDDDSHFDEEVETRDGVKSQTLSVDQGVATWTTKVKADAGETLYVKYDVQYLDANGNDTYIDRGANHSRPQDNDGTAQIKVRG